MPSDAAAEDPREGDGAPWALVLSVVLFGTTAWGIPAVMAAAAGEIRRAADWSLRQAAAARPARLPA